MLKWLLSAINIIKISQKLTNKNHLKINYNFWVFFISTNDIFLCRIYIFFKSSTEKDWNFQGKTIFLKVFLKGKIVFNFNLVQPPTLVNILYLQKALFYVKNRNRKKEKEFCICESIFLKTHYLHIILQWMCQREF